MKLPDALRRHIEIVMMSKSNVSTDRKRLAHPIISQDDLEIFLQNLSLGDGRTIDPLEVAMLKHLKKTSISEDNVRKAAAFGSRYGA